MLYKTLVSVPLQNTVSLWPTIPKCVDSDYKVGSFHDNIHMQSSLSVTASPEFSLKVSHLSNHLVQPY